MTDDPFLTHRSLLFTVAYEMLGSASDAEDSAEISRARNDGGTLGVTTIGSDGIGPAA